jgi:hypothetical protein
MTAFYSHSRCFFYRRRIFRACQTTIGSNRSNKSCVFQIQALVQKASVKTPAIFTLENPISKRSAKPVPKSITALLLMVHSTEDQRASRQISSGSVTCAKAFVIGTCSASNAKYVRELGADEVIDYRSEDVFQRAKAIEESTRSSIT